MDKKPSTRRYPRDPKIVQQYVRDGAEWIERQRQVLSELRIDNVPAGQAEVLLEALEATQRQHEEQLARQGARRLVGVDRLVVLLVLALRFNGHPLVGFSSLIKFSLVSGFCTLSAATRSFRARSRSALACSVATARSPNTRWVIAGEP
jgi:hypothetical protein